MAEKKNDEKEKKTVQIKATAGAWWKSTNTSDESPDTSVAPELKKEVVTTEEKAEKIAPRKRVRKKPTVTVSAEKADAENVEVSQAEEKETTPSKKPARKRPEIGRAHV